MPVYEYICEEDGSTIELLRSMSRADDPVSDPDGKGRRFIRKHSKFAVGNSPGSGAHVRAAGGDAGGCGCGCGCGHGGCGHH